MVKVIYVPEEDKPIWEKLEKISSTESRSISYLVNEIIRNYFEPEKEDKNEMQRMQSVVARWKYKQYERR